MPTKGELLASLSRALDLVEGQPEGHAVRACLLAIRLGQVYGLTETDQCDLFYASLLKDSGCANNSARIYNIFGGDEILCKSKVKFTDWSNPVESLKYGITHTEIGSNVFRKLWRMAHNVKPPQKIMADVTLARCTRGAAIVLDLGFSAQVSEAVRYIDEHWDGKGAPYGIRRDESPLLARILSLVQTFEVFATTFGVGAAFEMMDRRAGRWFDPDLVQAMHTLESDTELWRQHRAASQYVDIAQLAPADSGAAPAADIDRICQAYATIIDAKSTFTGEHSTRVTQYAVAIAEHLGVPADRVTILRRAALLHDIGKLGISNQILEKPGKLTDEEFGLIKLHPKHSFQILQPIKGFAEIAEIASCHHERLDGNGYWRGLSAESLSLEVRCLTVADILDALHAKRPYRDSMPMEECFRILEEQCGTAVDAGCVAAAKELYLTGGTLPAAA